MMMMSFGAIGLIGVLWVLYGYAIAFPAADGPGRALVDRLVGHRPHQPARDARGRRVPAARLRGLPGDLRDHHRRADLGCHRRPREVRRLDGLRRRLGDDRLLPGRQLGVQLRPRRGRLLRLRRLDHLRHAGVLRRGCTRLRRWHGGAHQRRCGRARPRARARQARRLPEGRARAPQPAASCSSAPVSCGSAGSASTPAPSSPLDGTAALAWINTLAAPAAALLGLARRREDQGRQADLGRCRIGRRRRPRRDHPGVCVPDAGLGHRARPRSPVRSARSRST